MDRAVDDEVAHELARAWGAEAGARVGSWGGLCPCGYDRPSLRRAWFEGFSRGRASLAREAPAMAQPRRAGP